MITPGEAATMAAELAMPDLDLIKQGEQGCRTGADGSPGAGRVIPPAPRTPQSARMAAGRIGSTTHRRVFTAELLQVQQRAIIDSIDDCNLPAAKGVVIARSRRRRSNLDGSASCPRLLRCARNDSKGGISGGVSRNLDVLVR